MEASKFSSTRLGRRTTMNTHYNNRMARNRKIRTEFRKTHQVRRRQKDLTRKFARDEGAEDKLVSSERISGKGELRSEERRVGKECRCRGRREPHKEKKQEES